MVVYQITRFVNIYGLVCKHIWIYFFLLVIVSSISLNFSTLLYVLVHRENFDFSINSSVYSSHVAGATSFLLLRCFTSKYFTHNTWNIFNCILIIKFTKSVIYFPKKNTHIYCKTLVFGANISQEVYGKLQTVCCFLHPDLWQLITVLMIFTFAKCLLL